MIDQVENSLQKARYLLLEGRKQEAIIDLVIILKQDSQLENAWYLLALALDDHEKKKFALEQLLSLNPHHSEAKKELEALMLEITDAHMSKLDRAVYLLRKKKFVEARKTLNDYLRQFPDDEKAWYLLGIAHRVPSQKARAFSMALKLNPSNERARRKLQGVVKNIELGQVAADIKIHPDDSGRLKILLNTFNRIFKYLLVRATTILITIFVGVFITILITNKNGQLDQNISKKIETQVQHEVGLLNTDEKRDELTRALADAKERVGLNLPFFPRHLRWTLNAMAMDWGDVRYGTRVGMFINQRRLTDAKDILLDRLPNSLILIAVANLIIFLIGIPLALKLARRSSKWQDKLFSFLSPISSIPSWIHGVILILVFSVEMQFLPVGGMFDLYPPEKRWEYVFVIGRHMILPVSAIVLSLFFQLVYSWRTYFLIYSGEDYVELAKAKGLSNKTVEKKYIFKPSAPFVITSFSLTLVGFWQMVIALEIIFNWPGIGQLYIEALPHFWGESMFLGEMTIAVSLVVLFAYILGIIVFVLDIVYAVIDPRVQIGNINIMPLTGDFKAKIHRYFKFRNPSRPQHSVFANPAAPPRIRKSLKQNLRFGMENLVNIFSTGRKILMEMRKYPSAIVGLIIILVLILGSLYAVIGMPYGEIGSRWNIESVSGQIRVPKLAQPAWLNIFRGRDLLSRIILDSRDIEVEKVTSQISEDSTTISINFPFYYDYSALPEEMILRISPVYREKRPFVNLTWVTPDFREIKLQGFSVDAENNFDLLELIPRKLKIDSTLLDERKNDTYGNLNALPLFIPPGMEGETPLAGTYTLKLEGLTFENEGDLDAELILLGQVYGAAGTDLSRRDLLVPLLWGMPFALLIGLGGAVVTTLLSLLVSGIGTWYGGWLDVVIQRINEAVMLLPALAIAVLLYAFFNINIWYVLIIMVILNTFGSPVKSFRAAFLQVRESPYVEAALAYGCSNRRIIMRYLIPRIIPVIIPQLVALTPGYVFLEATLGLFNIKSIYPTWGKVIHDALTHGFNWGSRYWVLEPIGLVLLTGFAFAMVGFALDQILNPKLKDV